MFIPADDLDSDGNLDLVVPDENRRKIYVLTGNGDGTFESVGEYQVGRTPYHVAVGHFITSWTYR